MKRPAKLLYHANKLSYSLMLLHVVFVTIYLIVVLANMTVDWRIVFVSLSNIVLLLYAFLVATKIKVYDHKFQYAPLFFAVYQFIQALSLPKGLSSGESSIAFASAMIAALLALAASIISIRKNKIRNQVIKEQNLSQSYFAK